MIDKFVNKTIKCPVCDSKLRLVEINHNFKCDIYVYTCDVCYSAINVIIANDDIKQ